jgi:hypothetical protein
MNFPVSQLLTAFFISSVMAVASFCSIPSLRRKFIAL